MAHFQSNSRRHRILKFGRNELVGNGWATLVPTAVEDPVPHVAQPAYVVSTSPEDTPAGLGAGAVAVDGICADGYYNHCVKVLDGLTPVPLPMPLQVVLSLGVGDTGDAHSNVGAIQVYHPGDLLIAQINPGDSISPIGVWKIPLDSIHGDIASFSATAISAMNTGVEIQVHAIYEDGTDTRGISMGLHTWYNPWGYREIHTPLHFGPGVTIVIKARTLKPNQYAAVEALIDIVQQ